MNRERSGGITRWPENERPRERLLAHGEHSLTDAELLAILLRVGVKGRSAVELARDIIAHFGSLAQMARAEVELWQEIHGLGTAKFAQIKAALELGRRCALSELTPGQQIRSIDDARDYVSTRLRDLSHEHFRVLMLNRRNNLLEDYLASHGSPHETRPVVREIIARALRVGASRLIAAHNHPSGSPEPSEDDLAWTAQLLAAANPLEIEILDHLIVTRDSVTSLADTGCLEELQSTLYPSA